MRDTIRHFASEFIGTFALVFIGGMALVNEATRHTSPALLEAALTHGLILGVMVSALMRISGHFNPAVTLGFLAARRIAPPMAVVYLVAQLLAAVLAAYGIKWALPNAIALAGRLGGQVISPDVSAVQAIALEAFATFFLTWVVFGTAVDPERPKIGGMAIGLTLTAGILAIGPYTGGSLNPARSFGPAVASGNLTGQAVYWIGPIIGGIVAALLYDRLFLRRGIEPVAHGPVSPDTVT